MTSFLYQFAIELRLYYRNKMALLYGYLFPTIFLVAFWVLYRHELVPLIDHMGELLTVTALGGACFGLPTAMVSERERGVWRRYRVAPVSTLQLVLGTLAARYVILISAALLQLILAMLIGMPLPEHLAGLWAAFTFVSFAFLGLGLVIAMLADNVPAVQALGQSIFLPMLIIGGVAVRIESLPVWAQHVSAFFPGRYSVQAVQETVNGAGLGAAGFSLLALVLVGAAGCVAAARMFRWDARERFRARGGSAWLGVALAAWVAVGVLAEVTGNVRPERSVGGLASSVLGEAGVNADSTDIAGALSADSLTVFPGVGADTVGRQAGEAESSTRSDTVSQADRPAAEPDERTPDPPLNENEAGDGASDQLASTEGGQSGESTQAAPPAPIEYPASWRDVTRADIDRDIRFNALPYDEGLEAPVAGSDEPMYPDIEATLDCILEKLETWPPAQVEDPVQRARNVLYVAAVPDMYQMSGIERFVPHAVFDYLRNAYPREQLSQVLYWIALYPEGGSVAAADRLSAVCLNVGGPSDIPMLRERAEWYAAKLLGRVIGRIEQR